MTKKPLNNHAFLISAIKKEYLGEKTRELVSRFIPNFRDKQFHPDITKIEAEKNSIGIDLIRNLKRQIAYKPFESDHKIIIIEEAEKLTIEAQNALLKTLEEPPNATILILTTKNYDLLLPTIISRCQLIFLGSQTENGQDFEKALEIVDLNIYERFKLADEASEEAREWLLREALFWRQLWLLKLGIGKINSKIEKKLIPLSENSIHKFLKNIQTTNNLIRQNVNPKLALEVLLLDAPSLN